MSQDMQNKMLKQHIELSIQNVLRKGRGGGVGDLSESSDQRDEAAEEGRLEPVSRCAERAPPDVPADPTHVPTHEQCDVADCDGAEFGCDASEWQSAPPSRNRSYGRPSGRSRQQPWLVRVVVVVMYHPA